MLAIVVAIVVYASELVPFLVGAAVAVAIASTIWRRWRRAAVVRRFRERYPGKDLLIVLTDSLLWRPYIEAEWLPRWGERAVVFNRSRPWSAEQPEAALWRALGGPLEHTPLAVVVSQEGRVKVVRFWKAFRDFKHGKDHRLRAAEAELAAALASRGGGA